jgi:doublecortin-like kinase 1/2
MVGDIIGDGNFAVVRRCFCKRTKREFALKVIDKSKCQGKEHMIESEVRILGLVAHSSIIELVEVFDFPDEKYLVTELVRGGDLFDAIATDTKYSEPVSRGMVRDLACALKYLHDRMIVHRDIKPENLLVVELGPDGGASEECRKTLKLADFGLAQVVSEPLFTVCGTPTYVAPEILAETGYGVKVDVWATGVIMYILLVGFPPFSSRTNNQDELFDQILSGLFEFNSPDWDEISYPAKELISWMLQVDPLQRYSAYEILEHPWIHKGS